MALTSVALLARESVVRNLAACGKQVGWRVKMRARKRRQRNRYRSAEAMWRRKRDRQRRDLAHLGAGTLTGSQTTWFSDGRSRAFELIDSPY